MKSPHITFPVSPTPLNHAVGSFPEWVCFGFEKKKEKKVKKTPPPSLQKNGEAL